TQALSPKASAQLRHAAFPESVPPPFPEPPAATKKPMTDQVPVIAPPPAPVPTAAAAPAKKFPIGMALMGVGLVVVGAIGVIALLQSQKKNEAPADEGGVVVIDKRAGADASAAAVIVDAGAA